MFGCDIANYKDNIVRLQRHSLIKAGSLLPGPLTIHENALARFLMAKGTTDLADLTTKDERQGRFFFGFEVDLPWDETLLLVSGIWAAFGLIRIRTGMSGSRAC
ncbi:hypothetical protein ASPVEDRAFT_40772 [Aspergillus versicolor CBS 583.65]|uniref:Uncharacterized protein n=1 Tax=Aspergillus versicolor CBS 583.65 TaxID=1036611 RepID=A0A1L9PI88_ASPVE|nr:uncharacterized protein ASPVEDRAFT_40772 [Aspergillus versicolor CBS 583.65]OJJ01218.1 hypothetical protein ASPVEDRAFT_40772 [Aspergillus versicolor CBS 583.65]